MFSRRGFIGAFIPVSMILKFNRKHDLPIIEFNDDEEIVNFEYLKQFSKPLSDYKADIYQDENQYYALNGDTPNKCRQAILALSKNLVAAFSYKNLYGGYYSSGPTTLFTGEILIVYCKDRLIGLYTTPNSVKHNVIYTHYIKS